MASFTPTAPADIPVRAARDHGTPPHIPGGGDDGGSYGGSPDFGARLRRARLGLIVALTPILMLFVSFTSAYIVRKGLPTLDPATNQVVHDWMSIPLPTTLFLINTVVLLLSSFTVELARRQLARRVALEPVRSIPGISLGKERNLPWLGMTIALGVTFLAGQWTAWRGLAAHGFFVNTGPSVSFVYLMTVTHAVHLIGGIVALSAAGLAMLLHKPLQTRRIVVDVSAWYWHFMALLWIYILALLEFAR